MNEKKSLATVVSLFPILIWGVTGVKAEEIEWDFFSRRFPSSELSLSSHWTWMRKEVVPGSATAIYKRGGLRQELILRKQSQEERTQTFCPVDCFQCLPKLHALQMSWRSVLSTPRWEPQGNRCQDVLFPVQWPTLPPGPWINIACVFLLYQISKNKEQNSKTTNQTGNSLPQEQLPWSLALEIWLRNYLPSFTSLLPLHSCSWILWIFSQPSFLKISSTNANQ